jgi:hypothetical protein
MHPLGWCGRLNTPMAQQAGGVCVSSIGWAVVLNQLTFCFINPRAATQSRAFTALRMALAQDLAATT